MIQCNLLFIQCPSYRVSQNVLQQEWDREAENSAKLARPLQWWGHRAHGVLCSHTPLPSGPTCPETGPQHTPVRAPGDPAFTHEPLAGPQPLKFGQGRFLYSLSHENKYRNGISELQEHRSTLWGLWFCCCCLFSEADQINFTAVENHANIVEKDAFNSLLLSNTAQQHLQYQLCAVF